MRTNLGFRSWFYFRQGWSMYFAFIFAAINTLVVTYYLAIDRAPFLKEIFPSFSVYAFVLIIIGIPFLIFIGYFHYKKSAAFTSEADVTAETFPYYYKLPPGYWRDVFAPLYLTMTDLLIKILNNEKLTDEELQKINELKEKLEVLKNGGYIGEPRKFKKNPSKKDTK